MTTFNILISELSNTPYKKVHLKEIAVVKNKEAITKEQLLKDGQFPVINSAREILGFYDKYNNDENTLVITSHGAYAGYCHFMEEKFWAGALCYPIQASNQNPITTKFLYYFLKENELTIRDRYVNKSGVPYINFKALMNMEINIPPVNIQSKIVEILDYFTNLISELGTELDFRKKQFDYRLNSIFDEIKTTAKLSDFSKITRGGNFQKKDFVPEGYPCIHYGQMYTHFGIVTDKVLTYLNKEVFDKSKIASSGDIIMAVTSETVEDVCSCTAWVGKDDVAISGHTAIIKHNQNPKYLSYYFHSLHFFEQKKMLAHGAKVVEVTPSKLGDIVVPLPSLNFQEKISEELDYFNNLCFDENRGIPAEINAREQQYYYCRQRIFDALREED